MSETVGSADEEEPLDSESTLEEEEEEEEEEALRFFGACFCACWIHTINFHAILATTIRVVDFSR